MSMDDNGTLSVEFLFTSMMILFICSGLVSVVSERLGVASTTEELSEARALSENVASSINQIHSAGNGQSMDILLPPAVGNSTYTLKVNSSGVYIEFLGMMGKADLYPMIIINGDSNTSNTVEMTPGKSYCIKSTNYGNTSTITIFSK
jgi:uncharacterized alpha/beta hydrolase family protein